MSSAQNLRSVSSSALMVLSAVWLSLPWVPQQARALEMLYRISVTHHNMFVGQRVRSVCTCAYPRTAYDVARNIIAMYNCRRCQSAAEMMKCCVCCNTALHHFSCGCFNTARHHRHRLPDWQFKLARALCTFAVFAAVLYCVCLAAADNVNIIRLEIYSVIIHFIGS